MSQPQESATGREPHHSSSIDALQGGRLSIILGLEELEASIEQEPFLRNRTLWAQALVLFNVCGIPLCYGPYLEFYFTTALPAKSLTSLATIIALQMFTGLAIPSLIGSLYQSLGERGSWRLVFIIAGVSASAAQLALQWCHRYELIVVLQGPVLGCALGTLFTISTLILSSHYKHDIALASTFCGFAGLTGAVFHSTLARQSFLKAPSNETDFAQASSAGIMSVTLLIAYFLMDRVEPNKRQPWTTRYKLTMRLPSHFKKDLQSPSIICFTLGYALVFFAIFIYPIYIVVLLTQPPTLYFPDKATLVLLTTLSTAACTACLSANERIRKALGPVNTFISAAVLAGAVVFASIRMPQMYITVPLAGAYGAALGSILTLHMMIAAVLMSPKKSGTKGADVPVRVASVMVLGGVCAFAGIVSAAVIMEARADGVDIVLKVVGSCLIAGGVFIGVARFMRWRGLFHVV